MSEVATVELGLAPGVADDNDSDKFDVFSSLRGGAESDNFSSGAGDIGEEATAGVDEAAGKFDLVAVASGEKKLPPTEEVSASIGQTACATCVGCPFLSQCIKPQALAVKQESESQDKLPDDMSSADEEAVPNLMEITPKQSYLERLLAPDDFDSLDENGRGELVMAGYSEPTDYQESITKKAPEPVVAEAKKPIDLTTKTDEPTEQIVQQERETKTSTNETVEASGEDVDTEAAETPFFELKTAPEIAADDTTDAGEALSESTSEISGEGHFTEPTEESRPSIEIKQQTSAIISGAADKEDQQPAFESPDILIQTKTRTVPSSPAVSEDTQTGDENRNPLEDKTVYPTASEDKVAANVVENTYDGDETTGPSSVTTPSIERQKENDLVIAGSKSANSEPSRVAENDESATPVSEQQHLAAQFEAVKSGESTIAEPVDNSSMKSPKSTQRNEVKLEAVTAYNDFTQSSDYTEGKQPEDLALDVGSIPLHQKRMVPAKYDENETYRSPDNYYVDQFDETPKVDNELTAVQVIDYSFSKVEEAVGSKQKVVDAERYENVVGFYRPQAEPVLSQTQISVENNKESLAIGSHASFDNNLVQLKIDNAEADIFVADDVINTTSKTDAPVKLEIRDNISPVKQLDYDDAAVEYCYDKAWAEEDMVFFVEQQESSAAESEALSIETMTVVSSIEAVALPMETITVCEETDDLETSVDDETEIASVKQLDNFKPALVPEITNDYEPEEQIVIPTSPAIDLIPDVELDEPAAEILEERIMPREERDNIVMEASEKSDLLLLDAEVETITTDTSGIESVVDLSEAQEELAVTEVSEAVESEVDEQNDLAVASAVDSYGYNSETSAVSDNVLVVKSRPSPGLWPDDSRLNPEEESASTAQSSADDTSLVSRLVGMFVVAMCVVRGRQSVKV